MTEEEMKAEIAKQIAALKQQHDDEIKGLKESNSKLKSEKQKAAEEAAAAKEAAEEAAAEKEREGKDIAAIEKRLADKHAKELSKLQDQLAERDTRLSTLLIDNALTTNLTKIGITDPDNLEVLSSYFKNRAKLDGDRAVIDGVDIDQAISDFAASERGKKFIPAPLNNGANATGSRAQGAVMPETWSLDAYLKMKSENPQVAVTYASKHGKSFD